MTEIPVVDAAPATLVAFLAALATGQAQVQPGPQLERQITEELVYEIGKISSENLLDAIALVEGQNQILALHNKALRSLVVPERVSAWKRCAARS